jgi:hypothetical protein
MNLAPYEALVALAEQERALALDGRWSELCDLLDRRAAVMDALPADDQAHAAMTTARATLMVELGGAGQTRAGVAGYRSATGAQAAATAADYRG